VRGTSGAQTHQCSLVDHPARQSTLRVGGSEQRGTHAPKRHPRRGDGDTAPRVGHAQCERGVDIGVAAHDSGDAKQQAYVTHMVPGAAGRLTNAMYANAMGWSAAQVRASCPHPT
jgi:hypothetical protein